MGKYYKRSLAIRASQVIKTEGWRALKDKITKAILTALYTHVPSGFNSMEAISGWLIEQQGYDIYSFDIFDTLIRRRIEPPELVKYLVAERISKLLTFRRVYVSPREVLNERFKIESVLRFEAIRKGKDPECCLDEIIRGTLMTIKGNNFLNAQEIINYEVDLEKRINEQMPYTGAILSHLKSLGKRVICTSETNLSEKQVRVILESNCLLENIDKLYISSDVGKLKSTNKLFEYVKDTENGKVIHIGDNPVLDYRIPSMLGIKSLWFNSKEEIKRKTNLKKLVTKNKMALVNAIVKHDHKNNNELYRIGYDILGPAITVFVHNVAEQSKKDGVKKLFFVARDGYGLKKVYEILRSNFDEGKDWPDSKYLCMSRLSLKLSSLHQLGDREMNQYVLKSRRKKITLRNFLLSYGLESNELTSIAGQYGIDIDEPINEPNGDLRFQELFKNNEFQELIGRQCDKAKILFRKYLKSIGFMGRHKVALVDTQSEGSSQSLLERTFINDDDFPKVYGYYFNIINVGSNLDIPQARGLIWDCRRNDWNAGSAFGPIMELFSCANHGTTIGYREINGKVMPIFKKTGQEDQHQVILQGLQGILDYAKDYSKHYHLINYNCTELVEDMKRIVLQWVSFPSRKDLEPLKGIFQMENWPEESKRYMVTETTFKDLVIITDFLSKIESSLWKAGTLRLAPVPGLNWLYYRTVIHSKLGYKLISHLVDKVV